MMAGAYSSIFIATPLLAQLKEREPDMKKLAKRVAARRAKEAGRGSSRGGDPARPAAPVPAGPRRAAGSTSVAVEPSPTRSAGESAAADQQDRVRPRNSEPSRAGPNRAMQELAAEAARTRVTVSSAAPLGATPSPRRRCRQTPPAATQATQPAEEVMSRHRRADQGCAGFPGTRGGVPRHHPPDRIGGRSGGRGRRPAGDLAGRRRRRARASRRAASSSPRRWPWRSGRAWCPYASRPSCPGRRCR